MKTVIFVSLFAFAALAEPTKDQLQTHKYGPTPAREYLRLQSKAEPQATTPKKDFVAFWMGKELYYPENGSLRRVMEYQATIQGNRSNISAKIPGRGWITVDKQLSLPRDFDLAMEYLVLNPEKVDLKPHEARAIAQFNFQRLKSGLRPLTVKKELQDKARELAAKQAMSHRPVSDEILRQSPYEGLLVPGGGPYGSVDADRCVKDWCNGNSTREHVLGKHQYIGLAGFSDNGEEAWIAQLTPNIGRSR